MRAHIQNCPNPVISIEVTFDHDTTTVVLLYDGKRKALTEGKHFTVDSKEGTIRLLKSKAELWKELTKA